MEKESISSSSSSEERADYLQLIEKEYRSLTTLEELSEVDAAKISAILDLAQYDNELHTALIEIDRLT